MPHFHIPLQSGSDEVLKLMHRRYDKALFAHKVNLIKEKMPDAFIGVDVMVGCRGETPECFEECYEFLKSLPVTQLHVFPYSERPGTAALKIPYVVDEKEKKLRSKRLLELSDQKTQEFYAQYIGTEAEVLFEKAPRGKAIHGFHQELCSCGTFASSRQGGIRQSAHQGSSGWFQSRQDGIEGRIDLIVQSEG